jgi:hypothetical protein
MGGPPQPSAEQEECMKQIIPLRDETQKRAQAIQAASKRRAKPDEACKIIQEFVKAESRFVNFISMKQTACHIPADVPAQLKANHLKSEDLQKKVCSAAANAQQQEPAGPSLSDVIGSPVVPEAPKKRSGGSTFDTLSGNVLAR